MAITQISRIQHRRGIATDLPQLAAGELGWVIDEQRLFIGNGTVADGAPAVGNTEIVTAGSASFTTALSYFYKGYLGASTPIVTGASGDFTRTVQAKLDDFASVKDFGALGDGSTNDTSAIQRALDELYTETDTTASNDERARRILYFPAGDYRINASIKIPPYAHLRGEGMGKTVIYMSASAPVAVFQDDEKNVWNDIIGSGGATTPTNITAEGITFQNGSAYGGVSIDNATNVKFIRCEFRGAYTAGGADNALGKGVTVRSTNAYRCAKILFDGCTFTKFTRLVDMSMDVTHVRFTNCDFNTAYYGAIIGDEWDSSTTNGMAIGPRDVQFVGSSWSAISQQAIYVKAQQAVEAPARNIISYANWYSSDVGNNFEGVGSIREVPVIQYDQDECTSMMDFFERTDLRRTDGSSELNMAPEVQGIGKLTNAIKQVTLTDATSATTTLEYPAGSGALGKSITLNYKIERGSTLRVGQFVISVSTNGVAYDDTYTESNGDAGVTLTAVIGREDSTSTDKTVIVNYVTTNNPSLGNAVMNVESSQLV